MKKVWFFHVIFAVCFVFVPPAAKAKKGKKEPREEMVPKPKVPQAIQLIVKGHDAFVLREYDRALQYYKDAAEESPKSPVAHYFIGCTQRAMKNYEEAIDSFKTAYLMAGEDAWWKGAASFNVALTYEQADKKEEALKAWKDFIKIATDFADMKNFVASAEKRIAAIEKYRELDDAYAVVRSRIAGGKE